MRTKSWLQPPCFISGRHVRVGRGHHESFEAPGQRPTSRSEALWVALQISLLSRPWRFSSSSHSQLDFLTLFLHRVSWWLNRAPRCSLPRNGMECAWEVPPSSLHAGAKGETSSAPPGYLTPLLVAVPRAGPRFSEAHTCKQAMELGFRRGGHIIGENPGSLSWFSFQTDIRGACKQGSSFFQFACRSGKTVDVSVLSRTSENSGVITQGGSLSCLTCWESSPHQGKFPNSSFCSRSFKLSSDILPFPIVADVPVAVSNVFLSPCLFFTHLVAKFIELGDLEDALKISLQRHC